jgi:Mitochondrial inner-membrane-bound regulator
MLRLPRSSIRHLHATATSCNRKISKQHVEHLPAEKLDSLASMLEQNAKVDSKTSAQETLFEMLEQDRPKSTNLRRKAYEKLMTKIDISYTVPQLQSYLRSQNIPAPRQKTVLVERIVKRAWGIESPEEREAARKVITEVLPSTKRDLVLLISDQGQFLQHVQNETKASITVQSHDQSLLLQGRKTAVEEAKKMLQDLPVPVETTRRQAALPERWQELERLIPEISKLTRAFISPEQDGVVGSLY